MKEHRSKKKTSQRSLILYITEIILACIIIYQSLERNMGGLIKEFNPLIFVVGLILLIMNSIFLYTEWKNYKEYWDNHPIRIIWEENFISKTFLLLKDGNFEGFPSFFVGKIVL